MTAVGCVGQPEEEAAEVHVTVTAGSVACGASVELSIVPHGFVLEAPTGQPNQAGHGHYHVYFHDASGDPLVAAASSTVAARLPVNATPGMHELHVVLMNNDHTEVVDAPHAVVQVEVAAAACVGVAMASTSVAAGAQVSLDIEVGNFTLEAPTGQANQPGHGHYHAYFHDAAGEPLVAAASSSTTVTIPADATPGTHELHVVLMNNDHTEAAAAHAVAELIVP